MDRHCVESPPWGSLRGSVATVAISLYLGRVITEKNGEIAALPLVTRNDGAVRYDLLGITSNQLGQYPPL